MCYISMKTHLYLIHQMPNSQILKAGHQNQSVSLSQAQSSHDPDLKWIVNMTK